MENNLIQKVTRALAICASAAVLAACGGDTGRAEQPTEAKLLADTYCASENQTCAFSGARTVRFGTSTTYWTKTFINGTGCNTGAFEGDPVPGQLKHCAIVPTTWTRCAEENGWCSFAGPRILQYGAGNTMRPKKLYDGTSCNNATFGDPVPGVAKHCDIAPGLTKPTSTSSGFVVSEAQFNQMFPNRSSFYTYSGLLTAMSYYPAFAKTGSDTVRKQEAAAFLANVAHESDYLRAVREYNTANWPLYCSHGIGQCGGKEYYGRGPIQLSWNYNYATAGNAMGVDLLNNPDLVATNAAIAWRTGVWYWMNGTGNAGTTPHNAMVNSQGFGVTIQAINGTVECGGKRPDQVQVRVTNYQNYTAILGVPTGSNLYC